MGGFGPPIPCGMPLFESGALNHSATSPFLQIFKYYFEGFYNLDLSRINFFHLS